MKKLIIILFLSGTALAQQPVRASKAFFDTLQSSHANLPVLVNDSLTVNGTVNGFTPRQGVGLSDTTKFVLKSDTVNKDPGYATLTQLATKQNTIAGLNNGATVDTVEFATKFLKNADSTTVKNTLLNQANTWSKTQSVDSLSSTNGAAIGRSGTVSTSTIYFGSTGGSFTFGRSTGEYIQSTQDAVNINLLSTGKQFRLGTSDANFLIFTTESRSWGAIDTNGNWYAYSGGTGVKFMDSLRNATLGTVNGFTMRQGSALSDTSQIAKVRWDTTAFTTTGLRVALSRPGMTAAGYAFVTPRITSDATPNANDVQLTAWCKNDSIVVHRIASGTSGLKITIWSKIP